VRSLLDPFGLVRILEHSGFGVLEALCRECLRLRTEVADLLICAPDRRGSTFRMIREILITRVGLFNATDSATNPILPMREVVEAPSDDSEQMSVFGSETGAVLNVRKEVVFDQTALKCLMNLE